LIDVDGSPRNTQLARQFDNVRRRRGKHSGRYLNDDPVGTLIQIDHDPFVPPIREEFISPCGQICKVKVCAFDPHIAAQPSRGLCWLFREVG
jgi:hypothetical protein